MKRAIKKATSVVLALLLFAIVFVPNYANAETVIANTTEELQDAFANGGDVALGADIDLGTSATVPDGVSVTLDLNGHNITATGCDALTVANGGTLTVTGTGTVTAVTAEKVAVYNNGTVTLNGGTFTHDSSTSGYVILNHGTMTIDGATVTNTNETISALVENGYFSYDSGNAWTGYVSGTNAAAPTLTITSGTLTGGKYCVKVDDGGVLTVNGGTLGGSAEATILNYNITTINGGTLSNTNGDGVIATAYLDANYDVGETTITGGDFTVNDGLAITSIADDHPSDTGFYTVSGGNFNGAPFVGPAGEDVTDVLLGSNELAEVYVDGNTYIVNSTYSVTLVANLDNSYVPSGHSLTTYTVGETTALPTDWIAVGHTFAGWYADEDLTGEAVTEIGPTEYGDKKFYAKWTPLQYTVNYVGVDADEHDNPATFTGDDSIELKPAEDRATETFAGWYLDEDYTTEAPATLNAVKYAEYVDDNNNITLYAKWEKISTTPTTPTDTTKSESPATGDDSGIGAFTVMMIAALGAAAAIGSRRRANNR